VNVKICATCKHLKIIDQGREFEFIADTEFTLFECQIFKVNKKEFYLMAPVEEELKESSETCCEFWEDWKNQE
jgi:hypothetical protein